MSLDAIIHEPGKFEGEPAFVRDVLWEAVMDGCEDDILWDGDTEVSVFFPGFDVRDRFGLSDTPRPVHAIAVWEDSQGFVRHRLFTRGQYERYAALLEEEEEE